MAMKQFDEETAKQIQELQVLEQNMQNLLLQKQAFQLESSETENALEELGKSSEETYKVLGQIMIKTKKQDLEKDLTQKKDILDLRLKSIEKQEQFMKDTLTKKRDDIMSKIQVA